MVRTNGIAAYDELIPNYVPTVAPIRCPFPLPRSFRAQRSEEPHNVYGPGVFKWALFVLYGMKLSMSV